MHLIAILHNIRSSHNVGSMFRTADAAGVAKLYLTGYTPSPRDRWGRQNKQLAKVALGAEKSMAWEYKKRAGKKESLNVSVAFGIAVFFLNKK